MHSGIGVLQLLSINQSSLVPILGKHSGHDESYSKQDECALAGFPWVEKDVGSFLSSFDGDDDETCDKNSFQEMHLLPECESYLKLRLLQTVEAGDHEVALCRIVDVGHWSDELRSVVSVNMEYVQKPKDEAEVLYTAQLRRESII